jgi:hypothetical protein
MPSKVMRFKRTGRVGVLRRFQTRRTDRDIHLVNGTSATDLKTLAAVMALEVNDETDDESQSSISCAPWVPSSATEDTDVVEPEPLSFNVKHPWGIIDYHLYLNSLEGGNDMHIRRENLYLFDGTDCEPIRYCDLFIPETYRMDESQRARLLFAILPIAEKGAVFGERNYVLGFDWKYRTLFARHFSWMPHDIRDIWSVWSEGTTVYTITISRLFSLLESTFQKRTGRAGEGILSSNPLCRSLEVNDDPGMEMVLATMFAQFAGDFIDVIFIQEEYEKQKFRHQLGYYEDQCRQVLQRASYRAWFALRPGSSRAKYRTEKNDDNDSFRQLLHDLYTLEEEERQEREQSNHLTQTGEWRAVDLETWRLRREEDRQKRREEAVQRLEGLFAIPSDLPEIKSPGQEFENMMIQAGEHPTIDANYPPDAPRTPSPPFRHRSVLQQIQCFSPGSPGIVRPAAEEFDGFEATEYHKIPLHLLLRRTLDLLEERPDLDSLDNRGQFGSLLTDLGVRVRKKPVDEFTVAPQLGYENDSWKLEVQTQSEIGDQPPRCLLPSPLLD